MRTLAPSHSGVLIGRSRVRVAGGCRRAAHDSERPRHADREGRHAAADSRGVGESRPNEDPQRRSRSRRTVDAAVGQRSRGAGARHAAALSKRLRGVAARRRRLEPLALRSHRDHADAGAADARRGRGRAAAAFRRRHRSSSRRQQRPTMTDDQQDAPSRRSSTSSRRRRSWPAAAGHADAGRHAGSLSARPAAGAARTGGPRSGRRVPRRADAGWLVGAGDDRRAAAAEETRRRPLSAATSIPVQRRIIHPARSSADP